jgi:hypothetical protein
MSDSVQQTAGLDSVLTPPVSDWLADDFLESYVCWREEAAEVHCAYEQWQTALEADEALAFAAYGAAPDREERAASQLCESAERISSQK